MAAAATAAENCPWARNFSEHAPLRPPYFVAKVQGALFHTQGGLEVGLDGRVRREDATKFPNLFAGGGDVVRYLGAMSAGYGNPKERDALAVLADWRDGYLEIADARAIYGVVIDSTTEAVNDAATAALRAKGAGSA